MCSSDLPHLDLGGGYGVVLIDDRQGPQFQQAEHGVLKILPPVLVVHILPSEEDLGHRVVVLGEMTTPLPEPQSLCFDLYK